MKKVVIIGGGPAGVSAALYTARAGLETTVLTSGPSSLLKAEKIENYYGFPEPVSGRELLERGRAGAERLGVRFEEAEAVGLGFEETLTVETTAGKFAGDAVIIATGNPRVTPKIAGIAELEGHGVSYCAICDAFFYKGRDVAVLGSGEYALHEVEALLPVAGSVTLFTNGTEPTAGFPEQVRIVTGKVKAVQGTEQVEGLLLENGTSYPAAGVFVAYGVAGSADLARKIGAETDRNRIVVNERMETTIPGLYAAGDCTGGLLQVAKAVSDGAIAGTEAAKALRR